MFLTWRYTMTDFDRVRPATTRKCKTCQDEEKKCPCPVDEDEVEVIEDDLLVSDPDPEDDDDDLVMYEDDDVEIDDDISGGLADIATVLSDALLDPEPSGQTACTALLDIAHQLTVTNKILVKMLAKM